MIIKRVFIIFIIAFCLISFVEFSCLAKETVTAGELWNDISMSNTIRLIYIRGIEGGLLLSEITTSTISDWYSFISKNKDTIIRVMDDLYKDPTNTYIDWPLICLIACLKLRGEDVEKLLKGFRKFAYQKYQGNKEKLEEEVQE